MLLTVSCLLVVSCAGNGHTQHRELRANQSSLGMCFLLLLVFVVVVVVCVYVCKPVLTTDTQSIRNCDQSKAALTYVVFVGGYLC